MTAISGLLRTIPLLGSLSPSQLDAVASICDRRTYSAGDEIVKAGDPADAAYFLIDGNVDCVVSDGDGKSRTTPVPAGATLLELAMIVEIDVSATCTARGTAKALRIPRKEMHDLMQENVPLTDAVIEMLTIRLREMADTMREVSATFEPEKKSA